MLDATVKFYKEYKPLCMAEFLGHFYVVLTDLDDVKVGAKRKSKQDQLLRLTEGFLYTKANNFPDNFK